MWRNRGVPVNIPENYGAVFLIHGRKQFVVQGQSFNIQPNQGHELQFFYLREQSRQIQHTCDTADQLRVNLDIEMRWQHVSATMFLFLNSTDDPPSAIEKSVKAELTSQINKNDYQSAMKALKLIAMRVTNATQIRPLNMACKSTASTSAAPRLMQQPRPPARKPCASTH